MAINDAYCMCSTEKTKVKMHMKGKFEHNMRLKEVLNADPAKRALNEVLIGDDTIKDVFKVPMKKAASYDAKRKYKTFIDYADDAIKEVQEATGRKVRKDAVLEIEVVLTFSPGAEDNLDLEAWKEANVQWLKDYFTEENVKSAVLHMDETTPHIHAIITPIDRENGKVSLNAKKWTGGSGELSRMQTNYANAMKQFGLKRGEQFTRARHEDLKRFAAALNNIVRVKLPERSDFKTEEGYIRKTNELFQEANMRIFALEKTLERFQTVDTTREHNQSFYRDTTERTLNEYEERIQTLEQRLEQAEKKARFVEHIQERLDNMVLEDPTKAEELRKILNELAEEGAEIEKKKKRKQGAVIDDEPVLER